MNHPRRLVLFFVGAIGVAVLYGLAIARLPSLRTIFSPYAEAINSLSVPQRHATDAVAAVNFDYRGFDTLGEEFILFVSVMGTLVLMREAHAEEEDTKKAHEDAIHHQRDIGLSEAVRVTTVGITGPTVAFGVYVILHGQLTPGGGFQGGVILATAPLVIYLAENLEVFRRIIPMHWIEFAEAVGAGAYILIGLAGLFVQGQFLANVLPLGTVGQLASAGTIPVISLATGLEVTAGFVLLLYAFLVEVLVKPKGGE